MYCIKFNVSVTWSIQYEYDLCALKHFRNFLIVT